MRYLLAFACLALLLAALACGDNGSGGSDRATPSPGRVARTATPRPATPSPATADKPVYIALGNSLSAGIGASNIRGTAFVPLVHEALGDGFGLMNLGVSGDTSDDLLRRNGPLERATDEMERRRTDAIEGNEVRVVTLEIGGNDLLGLYTRLVLTRKCPSVTEALQRPECVQGLRNALDNYEPNLEDALRRLKEADPAAKVFLMTLYNPFSGGSTVLDEIGEMALEGLPDTTFPDGINDIIRAQAAAFGAHIADVHPLFLQKYDQYISGDMIHPNDTGYRVMADAFLEAMAQAGAAVER